MKLKILFVLLCSLVLTECKKEEPEEVEVTPSNTFESYNRKGMLENIGNNSIIPAYLNFKEACDSLMEVVVLFKSDPTEANLVKLQDQWKVAGTAWKKCELFKIGPGASLGLGYYSSIDFHPTNPTEIENSISAGSTIDNSYIESKGASAKGLPALEYLLFNRSNGTAYVTNQFSASSDVSGKRKDYVHALCENLQSKAAALYNAWIPLGGNYIATFVAADGKDINSSIGILANQMIYLTEVIKNVKVGQPLGTMNSGVAQPDAVEAGQSESSLNFIRANVESLENTFLGKGTQGDLSGFDDLLNHLDARKNNVLLSELIKTQFQTIYTKLDAITPPMQDAVTSSPTSVQALYDELFNLIVLLKVDMAGKIGIVLTISDNDGD